MRFYFVFMRICSGAELNNLDNLTEHFAPAIEKVIKNNFVNLTKCGNLTQTSQK